jgi:hypothetical protein
MQSAGLRALFIDRATARVLVQKIAVSACPAGHGEDLVLGVEVVDQAHLQQPLGDQLGLDVFDLERVHQLQAHQIRQAYLQRHGAAIGRAAVTHAGLVLAPGFQAVDVNNADGGFHFGWGTSGRSAMLP